MRQNDGDNGKTVAAMDLLVPEVGELMGGSMREERYIYIRTYTYIYVHTRAHTRTSVFE